MAALIFPIGFYISEVGGQPYKLPNNTVVGSSYVLFVLSIFFTIVGLLFAGKVCLPGWCLSENLHPHSCRQISLEATSLWQRRKCNKTEKHLIVFIRLSGKIIMMPVTGAEKGVDPEDEQEHRAFISTLPGQWVWSGGQSGEYQRGRDETGLKHWDF